MPKQLRWQEIANALAYHEAERRSLSEEWERLKAQCSHPDLPKHGVGEYDYYDRCDRCGYVAYCQAL